MKKNLHITYNDGSNPFVMIRTDIEIILEELKFQFKANIKTIQAVQIF